MQKKKKKCILSESGKQMFPTQIWSKIQLFVLIFSIPYFTGGYKQPNKAGFLNFGNIGILIPLCFKGGCPVHYRMISFISGLCLPNTSSTLLYPQYTIGNASRHFQMSLGKQKHNGPSMENYFNKIREWTKRLKDWKGRNIPCESYLGINSL